MYIKSGSHAEDPSDPYLSIKLQHDILYANINSYKAFDLECMFNVIEGQDYKILGFNVPSMKTVLTVYIIH